MADFKKTVATAKAKVAKADPTDGVHLDANNTRAIGKGLVPVVKGILNL